MTPKSRLADALGHDAPGHSDSDQARADAAAREGYDGMAEVYAGHVGAELASPSLLRSVLDAFADRVGEQQLGKVADLGCGPGHVTAYLAARGLDVVGVDNSPTLLDIARADHPNVRFEIGQLASLRFVTASLGAVVSKHSLIHTPADLVPAALSEFARVLVDGGLLYLSFFGAAEPDTHGRSFDHAVTTAYELDVDVTAELLSAAGFVEELRLVEQPRPDERQLPHVTFLVRRA